MPVLEYLQPPAIPKEKSMNYRLPVEIIWLILGMLMDGSYLVNVDKRPQIARNIVHFSQVCQHWRQAALGLKEVWAYILNNDVDSESWTKLLLFRSENAPLTIASRPNYVAATQRNFWSAKWAALLSQMHRVKEFDVTISEGDDNKFLLWTLSTTPAPILKVLHLEAAHSGTPVYPWRTIFIRGPNTFLFRGIAPNLQCLILRYVNIDPSVLRGFNLRHLEVTGMRDLSASRWLTFLNSQHEMEHLEFQVHQNQPHGRHERLPLERPNLAKLKTLILRANNQASADLVGHLILPTSCIIRVILEDIPPHASIHSIGSVTPLFSGLQRRFSDWGNKAKSNPALCFVWNIELKDDSLSVCINSWDRNFPKPDSSLELSMKMGVEHELPTEPEYPHVVQLINDIIIGEVGSRIFDMFTRSCDPILEYEHHVSIIADYKIDSEYHQVLTPHLKLFLSLLSNTVTTLNLFGSYTHSFITRFLYRETSPLFPKLELLTFVEEFDENYQENNKALNDYLQSWRSRYEVIGKRLLCIVNPEDIQSFYVDDWCSNCRF